MRCYRCCDEPISGWDEKTSCSASRRSRNASSSEGCTRSSGAAPAAGAIAAIRPCPLNSVSGNLCRWRCGRRTRTSPGRDPGRSSGGRHGSPAFRPEPVLSKNSVLSGQQPAPTGYPYLAESWPFFRVVAIADPAREIRDGPRLPNGRPSCSLTLHPLRTDCCMLRLITVSLPGCALDEEGSSSTVSPSRSCFCSSFWRAGSNRCSGVARVHARSNPAPATSITTNGMRATITPVMVSAVSKDHLSRPT